MVPTTCVGIKCLHFVCYRWRTHLSSSRKKISIGSWWCAHHLSRNVVKWPGKYPLTWMECSMAYHVHFVSSIFCCWTGNKLCFLVDDRMSIEMVHFLKFWNRCIISKFSINVGVQVLHVHYQLRYIYSYVVDLFLYCDTTYWCKLDFNHTESW